MREGFQRVACLGRLRMSQPIRRTLLGLLAAAWLALCVYTFHWLLPLEPSATIGPQEERQFYMFTPDGRAVIAHSPTSPDQSDRIEMWDLSTGHKCYPLIPNWDNLKRIAFSADGTRLAGLYGEADLPVWDFPTGQELASFKPRTKDREGVNFCFSPDGQFLLAEGDPGVVPEEASVTVRDLRTGKEWASIETDLASTTWW
jgi:WD40 repeat protein